MKLMAAIPPTVKGTFSNPHSEGYAHFSKEFADSHEAIR